MTFATPVDGALLEDEIVLHGRVMPASNATFVGEVAGTKVVYKPVAGERPLWDFPDGTLADREVAAYLVSEVLGWDVVPQTWLREGPHGLGMVQAHPVRHARAAVVRQHVEARMAQRLHQPNHVGRHLAL